jgi:hypothetical protein
MAILSPPLSRKRVLFAHGEMLDMLRSTVENASF